MKASWIWAAVGFVVGGLALFAYQKKFRPRPLNFLPEPEEDKNFEAFPPEIPAYEFEGIDFV